MTSYTAISLSKYVGHMDRLGIDHTGSVWYNYMLVGYVKGHFRFLLCVFTFFLIEYCCLRRKRSIKIQNTNGLDKCVG